jgi:hypothetical protein
MTRARILQEVRQIRFEEFYERRQRRARRISCWIRNGASPPQYNTIMRRERLRLQALGTLQARRIVHGQSSVARRQDGCERIASRYSGAMISSLRERQSSTAVRTCIL